MGISLRRKFNGVPSIISKSFAKTRKIVDAHRKLARRLSKPKNLRNMMSEFIRGKGLVLPGSKYIGPGNEMNKGAPVDEADANAYQHDLDYDKYLKQGHSKFKVYTGYSDADKRLLKKTENFQTIQLQNLKKH